ncbi:MAG TPA: VanZ family protein [Mobilitalea sp.]|nr:VanZ family protein [Mobilitalea sp.]
MKLKYISWLPAAIIMVLIFLFSSKPAVSSNATSLPIANSVLTAYESVTNTHYEAAKRDAILENINYAVRKGAHFSEYALLACALAFHLLVAGANRKWLILCPIIICALYATTDEYHQTFVPGRSGRITDAMIDTTGAATGAVLFFFLVAMHILNNRKKASITTLP